MKNIQQVVSEIKGSPVTMDEALKMAENNFGQIYAWVKADVVAKLLEEKNKIIRLGGAYNLKPIFKSIGFFYIFTPVH